MQTQKPSFKTPFALNLAATKAEINQHAVRNSDLSVHASHLLAVLADCSEGFIPRREWMKTKLKCGEHIIRRVLSELRDAGYIKTRVIRDAGGKIREKFFDFVTDKIPRWSRVCSKPLNILKHFNCSPNEQVFEEFTPIEQDELTIMSVSVTHNNFKRAQEQFELTSFVENLRYDAKINEENFLLRCGIKK